jgi:ribosomal protein S18 acetylase RimI-like enzyme
VKDLALRPAQPTESDFCYAVHEQTMREYVEAMFGAWDDALQRRMHESWFDSHRVKVIELHGEAVGIVEVESRPGDSYVSRIEVLPQGRGIGSRVLNDLIARGPVQLHVFAVNTRARALYERLGFVPSGEAGGRLLMKHPGATNA